VEIKSANSINDDVEKKGRKGGEMFLFGLFRNPQEFFLSLKFEFGGLKGKQFSGNFDVID
jgi:hypothetical protein